MNKGEKMEYNLPRMIRSANNFDTHYSWHIVDVDNQYMFNWDTILGCQLIEVTILEDGKWLPYDMLQIPVSLFGHNDQTINWINDRINDYCERILGIDIESLYVI